MFCLSSDITRLFWQDKTNLVFSDPLMETPGVLPLLWSGIFGFLVSGDLVTFFLLIVSTLQGLACLDWSCYLVLRPTSSHPLAGTPQQGWLIRTLVL